MDVKNIISQLVQEPTMHAKWLNTLSMMENSGARKISASEHPAKVNIEVLKHATEEARHAYYLKKQLSKLNCSHFKTYDRQHILAPIQSYQYLHQLDTFASRLLIDKMGLDGYELKWAAYLLVTYTIEVRADYLYPIYQDILQQYESGITVRSIIVEEQGHLEEMIKQLKAFSENWEELAEECIAFEDTLFNSWMETIQISLN